MDNTNRMNFDMNKEKKRFLLFLVVGIVLLFITFCLSLIAGRYKMSLNQLVNAIFTSDASFDTERSVIMLLRLPRSISAILVGAALSVSGLIYQELFQNKLVSPDLLGVSSGAGFGAALAIILGASMLYVGLIAFVFGLLTVALTLGIAKLFSKNTALILLLSGVVVSGFMSSALSMVKFFADQETTLAQITFWLMGSFEYAKMEDLKLLFPLIFIGTTTLVVLRNRINVIALGREDAKASGVSYDVYKYILIVISTLLTAISISFYGVISWIGLVIPHIVRLAVGRQTQFTIPITIVFGGIFMLLADIICRAFTASEIPISAITGLIGTPIFIAILFLKKQVVKLDD